MSSAAALQPGLPTTVPSLNTIPAASSTRPYASSHSSPTREAYHANHANPASPSSSRRPSRKNSGNNGGVVPNSPQAPSQTNSPMSSRAAVASPVAVAADGSSSDRKRHAPPVAPPRTSSNRHEQAGAAAASGSRRAAHAAERAAGSPRRAPEAHGVDDASGQASRRRQHHHAAQEPPQRTSSSRDPRGAAPATSLPVRSHGGSTTATSSKGPSREASEILSSMVVTTEDVDIEREKARVAMAKPQHPAEAGDAEEAAPAPPAAASDRGEETRRGGRSRHDHSKREKPTRFGEYILGNTIGEGEFGKVKLGWKQEGGVQVAIKLIKKDSLGNNPTRMAKIMREVSILKQLRHPNIVQLHKMEESERHFGIVLEYASGGELFDYILNHRYLKDNSARRLFAQLISGVGYLHKKGIVHRDLKLENLLLDRNRNIIITDFGFANTFDPNDELTEEEEKNLGDKEFVQRQGLDKVKPNGLRRGDLMQTSCGSPCYAAPELVVSDSLYSGRKVDVWSCGVILYAMLAGYLPFDDDPANPEGDNINLLYKYIVGTPLTFPEYVTPHARDLLRRILVPHPRKRADLFEVARHTWLSEYAHVVELITSTTTAPGDVQNIPVSGDDMADGTMLGRSASVRDSAKKATVSPTIGGLTTKHGTIDPEAEAAILKQQKDNKRRTVQVEYVAPTTQTQRGEAAAATPAGKTRARSGSQGPVEVASSPASPNDKPLPRDPPGGKSGYAKGARDSRRPPPAHQNPNTLPVRPHRDGTRAASDTAFMTAATTSSGARPSTGGALGGSRVAGTSARASIQQPKGTKNYVISNPIPQDAQSADYGQPGVGVPAKFARVAGFSGEGGAENKGHRRSNTIGELFSRRGSIFGGKGRKRSEQQQQPQQPAGAAERRRYPPVSMANAIPAGGDEPRTSMDSKRSRRSFSLGLGKKRSGSISGSQTSQEKTTRRFSLIPNSFSLKAIGIGKEYGSRRDSQHELPIQDPPPSMRQVDQRVGSGNMDAPMLDGMYAQLSDPQQAAVAAGNSSPVATPIHQRYASVQLDRQRPSAIPTYMRNDGANTGSNSSLENAQVRPPRSAPYPRDYQDPHGQDPRRAGSRGQRGVLQKNKRLADAYDTDEFSRPHDHSGSSGAARRVMDFFRRAGRSRGGEIR